MDTNTIYKHGYQLKSHLSADIERLQISLIVQEGKPTYNMSGLFQTKINDLTLSAGGKLFRQRPDHDIAMYSTNYVG
jgi:hypothetical protein